MDTLNLLKSTSTYRVIPPKELMAEQLLHKKIYKERLERDHIEDSKRNEGKIMKKRREVQRKSRNADNTDSIFGPSPYSFHSTILLGLCVPGPWRLVYVPWKCPLRPG